MRTADKIAIVVLLPALIGYAGYYQLTKTQTEDAATAAGFDNVRDFAAAKDAGISDPKAWQEFQTKLAAVKAKREEEQYERTRNPATKMTVKNFSWTKSGFGVIGVVNLTVENMNGFPVKDITIGCSFNGASGTQLSNPSNTIYETIKPNSSRTFKDFNIGFIHSQAQRGGCSVDSARRL